MKKTAIGMLLLLATTTAFAAEEQAHLGIFAETSVMKMAGMPAMPALPAGIDPSMMAKMPGMASLMGMGAPQRKLTVRLWSPGIAPAKATAFIEAPAALKQGKRLDLSLYRPQPEKTEAGNDADENFNPEETPNFTIKFYWGSSDTVKPGQPKVISWGKLTDAQKQAMRKTAAKSAKSGSYFYKPDWTTGYWPTEKQRGNIAKDASLVGKYTLTTSYTGSVALDVPENVDFLAPIDLISPKLAKAPALADPLVFQWQPIPHLLGSHAMIFGMQGENTLILWSSSEIPSEWSVDWDYLQMAQVEAMVKSTEMMAGDRENVHVPAGIFKECKMVSFSMTGYGPGVSLAQAQPLPRLQTKTSLTVMLSSMGMDGMGDGEEEN